MKNCITISISDSGIGSTFEHPMTLFDILNVLGTVMLGALNDVTKEVPEDHLEEFKKDVYDDLNAYFSQILTAYAPELEKHPDLTTEAILKAENDILNQLKTSDSAKQAVKDLRKGAKHNLKVVK